MIQLIGLKSNCPVEVRERLSIMASCNEGYTKELLKICEEAVIISTCNRTEIYFNANKSDGMAEKVFEKLLWDLSLKQYIFHIEGTQAVKHLMELACGFHSKILGEDQILSQIKGAYEIAFKIKGLTKELQRLFQMAITCGKEFRNKTEMYKIPVSSSSIVVKDAMAKGKKKFMLLGYGEVGKLITKYLLSQNFDILYIAVRDIGVVNVEDSKVKVIPFEEREYYYSEVDCIISCTSAQHCVVLRKDLPSKPFLIYDLAIPRDVEEQVVEMQAVELFDIDKISLKDDENRKTREVVMKQHKYIVCKYIEGFQKWQDIKKITPHIRKLKINGEKIYSSRYETFINKKDTKDTDNLAKTLLKSTSDAYINKAIEVLKEEQLKGRGEECLRIIEKIFYLQS